MTDDSIKELFTRIGRVEVAQATIAAEVRSVQEQLRDMAAKQDRAYWFALTQFVIFAGAMVAMILKGAA